jgi:hypothetical protein
MKITLWIMAALLLSACGSTGHNKTSAMQPADLGSNGFIVISTFADAKSITSASTVIIRQAGHRKRVAILQIDNFAGKPDFSPGWGFLYALPVPPGDYVMELGSMNPYRHYSAGSDGLGFTVTAGAKTYLGEAYYFLSRDGGKRYGHIQMLDKADRDIPLFRSRFPAYSADVIVRAIPHQGEVF